MNHRDQFGYNHIVDSKYGDILITAFRNALGKTERLEYQWRGKPIAQISRLLLLDDMNIVMSGKPEFSIGPYRVRILENELWLDWITVIRKDYPLWWAIIAWHRINRLLDIAYHRAIITFAVWGLASYSQTTIPTWRDIYLVQWIKKLGK